MFLENKYNHWYHSIVANRQLLGDPVGYSEEHHIMPLSLGGGKNKENCVRLTVKEHFLLHWLLTKFTIGKEKRKMCFALHRMRINHKTQRALQPWQIELSRQANSDAMVGNTNGAGNKGKPKRAATKEKMREAAIKRNESPEYIQKLRDSSFVGKHGISENTKAKLRIAAKTRPPVSEVTKQKLTEAGKRRKHSETTKAKMRVIALIREQEKRDHIEKERLTFAYIV